MHVATTSTQYIHVPVEVHVLHTNRFDREQAIAYLKAVGNALTTIFIRQSEQAVACLKAMGGGGLAAGGGGAEGH